MKVNLRFATSIFNRESIFSSFANGATIVCVMYNSHIFAMLCASIASRKCPFCYNVCLVCFFVQVRIVTNGRFWSELLCQKEQLNTVFSSSQSCITQFYCNYILPRSSCKYEEKTDIIDSDRGL